MLQIALVPRFDKVDILQDEDDPRAVAMRTALEDNNCREYFLSGQRETDIKEECRDALRSLSMYFFEGGFNKECVCDDTGSESSVCDPYSGQVCGIQVLVCDILFMREKVVAA